MNAWHFLAVVTVFSVLGTAAAAQDAGVVLQDDTVHAEFVITIGPVDLPIPGHSGHGGDGGHSGQGAHGQEAHGGGADGAHAPVFPPIDEFRIPFDVYLHGFSYRIVGAAGEELPVEILHHLNLIMPDNRELFLPISHRLLAVGKETGAQRVPGSLIGVPVDGGQRVVVAAMLHNPTGRAYRGVTVEVRLAYVKASERRPALAAFPFQMDVGFPAGDKDVDLPPGRSVFTWEGSPAIPGEILVIGGHLHEHAVGLELVDVTTGEALWQGRPSYDEEGDIVGVTVDVFDEDSAILLDPSHTYRIVSTYHNPTADTLYSGGMGVVGGVFLPADGARWPAADRSNRLYRLDRLHYMRKVRGRYEDIAAMIEDGELSLNNK